MEPSQENSATLPHNGLDPVDDQKKPGLGFQLEGTVEDEEAHIKKKLIEEIEGLVLREQIVERKGLGEVEVEFHDGDTSAGYKTNSSNIMKGSDQNSDVGFYDKYDLGSDGKSSYPVRPDAEDCPFYMRFGSCKFGPRCKYNHPLNWKNQYPNAAKDKKDSSERPAKQECRYFKTHGRCKHGEACQYSHIRVIAPASPRPKLNSLCLPIRPGERDCSFYVRNGSCKFGTKCRFNHPEPTTLGFNACPEFGNSSLHIPPQANIPLWSSPGAVNERGPFLSIIYNSPLNGVSATNLEWNNYQATGYPANEMNLLATSPAFSLNNHNPQMLVGEFPERPGEPECSYYMKTRQCKFGALCKFHHPKDWKPPCALSDKGLPLRPDHEACTYYIRTGICKYGPACRYDHPVEDDNSASSTASEQVPLSTLG